MNGALNTKVQSNSREDRHDRTSCPGKEFNAEMELNFALHLKPNFNSFGPFVCRPSMENHTESNTKNKSAKIFSYPTQIKTSNLEIQLVKGVKYIDVLKEDPKVPQETLWS